MALVQSSFGNGMIAQLTLDSIAQKYSEFDDSFVMLQTK